MISLEEFPFTTDCLKNIEQSISNYWRMARIYVDVKRGSSSEGQILIDVTVHQKELVNSRILSSDELITRGQGIFDGCIPEGFSIRYNPITFKK